MAKIVTEMIFGSELVLKRVGDKGNRTFEGTLMIIDIFKSIIIIFMEDPNS